MDQSFHVCHGNGGVFGTNGDCTFMEPFKYLVASTGSAGHVFGVFWFFAKCVDVRYAFSFAGIGLGKPDAAGCLSAISLNAGEIARGGGRIERGRRWLGAMAESVAGSFLYEVHPVVPFECCLWVLSGMIVMACLIKPQTKEHTQQYFIKDKKFTEIRLQKNKLHVNIVDG